MNKKVGFGIIGAGMIAEMHASALQVTQKSRLIGFYDPVIAAAESRAAQFNCKVYRTLEEMLADPEIDAVTIATPSGLHGRLSIAVPKPENIFFVKNRLKSRLKESMKSLMRVQKTMFLSHLFSSPVFQSRCSG